jgi:hypothetical protein
MKKIISAALLLLPACVWAGSVVGGPSPSNTTINGGTVGVLGANGSSAASTANPLPTEQTDGSGNVIGTSSHPLQVTSTCAACATATNQTAVQSAPGTPAATVVNVQLSPDGTHITPAGDSSARDIHVAVDTHPPVVQGAANAGGSGNWWHITLDAIGGSSFALGQAAMSGSIPVVIASNQSAIPASQSGTWTVQPGNTANTTAWLVGDSADGSATGGAAGTLSQLAGGIYKVTPPTLTDGQQSGLALSPKGYLRVSLLADGTTSAPSIASAAASAQPTQSALWVNSQNQAYNGTNWDFNRNNSDLGAIITASSATTTQTSADQTNFNGRGVIMVVNVTSAGTGSITCEIDGKDGASSSYPSLLTGAAITTNSTNVYTVYPGAPATANVSANSPVPRTFRAKCTANNANAMTYTVGINVIY